MLVVALLSLVALFPKYLAVTILENPQPSETTLSYLKAFRKFQPQNTQLILSLIEQEINLGQLHKAKKDIAYLKNIEYPLSPEINHQLAWLHYLIVRYKTYHAPMNTSERIHYLKQSRQITADLARLPLDPRQLKAIAHDSLSLSQPNLALQIYNNLMKNHGLTTPQEFVMAGNVAMQNNAQLDSAKFYWAAFKRTLDIKKQKQYALKTIQTLWAGNFVAKSLLKANQLPETLIDDRHTLLYLSRLALAANQLETAEHYVLKALIQSNTDIMPKLKKIPYDDEGFKLLFKLLIYQANIAEAYQLAFIATTKQPNDLTWHTHLAQTAIWAGDYNQGMKEWLYVSEHASNPKKIKHAILLAKILGYDTVAVKMLKSYLIKNPSDTSAVIELAEEQNRIAQPHHALLTLHTLNQSHPNLKADELIATIYQDLGEWNQALKTWQQIDRHYGPTTRSALAQAVIYYTQNHLEQALDVLKRAIPTAKPRDKRFWETFANLAWMLNKQDLAMLGYAQDPHNSSHLLRLISLQRTTHPQQALYQSLKGWARFNQMVFFYDALYIAEQLSQWSIVNNLLANLSNEELQTVQQTELFWQTLANLYATIGLESLQKNVLVQGIFLLPEFNALKASLLWLIINDGEAQTLRHLLQEWSTPDLINDSTLWQAIAEAYSALNQVNIALAIYQHHLLQDYQKEQVLIDYTNLLDKAGFDQKAYDLRHYLWSKILFRAHQNPHVDNNMLQSISQLSVYFVSGTDQIQLLNALMKNHFDEQNINILLNWLVAQHAFELISYIKAYWIDYQLPDRIAIYLALINNDLPTLQKIMGQTQKTLPHADHINAAVRLENTPLAEALAFQELTGRPLAHETYNAFTQNALTDSNKLAIAEEYEQFIDLVGTRTRLGATLRLTRQWQALPFFNVWNVKTNNRQLITNVPSQDLNAGIQLHQKIHRGNANYRLAYREALNHVLPLDVNLNYQLASQWHASVNLGYNQEIFQTSYLRIGGVQDELDLRLRYNISSYDSAQAAIQGFNYYSQDRHYLADGYFLHGLYEHKFWLSYPDYTLGAFGNVYHFNRNGSYGGDITTLFPQQSSTSTSSQTTQATNYQLLVPEDYNEGGFIFSVGNAILDYTRAWRPYVWASLYYNSFVGFSNDVKFGMNGSVFGRDSLLLYAEHATSPAVKNAVNQTIGARYAFYF